MINYTVISGTPTEAEKLALELALTHHKKNEAVEVMQRSTWGRPILRAPFARKN